MIIHREENLIIEAQPDKTEEDVKEYLAAEIGVLVVSVTKLEAGKFSAVILGQLTP